MLGELLGALLVNQIFVVERAYVVIGELRKTGVPQLEPVVDGDVFVAESEVHVFVDLPDLVLLLANLHKPFLQVRSEPYIESLQGLLTFAKSARTFRPLLVV